MQLSMDDIIGSESSDLRLEDLMDEYSSQPSMAEWIWCIEYVAKFKKDIRCILAIMNMDLQCPDDLGKRTNEVVALRILEFLFKLSKRDANNVGFPSTSEPRVEFDLSLSSVDVLQTILKEIPLSDLRPGMAELSKFNVLAFIAHKNACLPKCALERLRDAVLKENQTKATPSREATEAVLRDKQPRHIGEQTMHTKEQLTHTEDQPMHIGEQPACIDEPRHMDEQPTSIGEQTMRTEEQPMHTEDQPMHKGEQPTCIDEPRHMDEQPTHIGEQTIHIGEQPTSVDEQRVHINGQENVIVIDDDSDNDEGRREAMVKPVGNGNTYESPPSSSRTRQDDVCVKCRNDGTLLICSSRDCSAMVHEECLNGPVWRDENGNFHCPQCWYHRLTSEYLESKKSTWAAKEKLAPFLGKLAMINRRLRDQEHPATSS